MDFGEAPLREPFFHETVERLQQRRRPASIAVRAIDSLIEVGAAVRFLSPSGFIFHMSRCGSTLVANALRALDDTIVASEPQPLTELLAPYSAELWPDTRDGWPWHRDALLHSTMRIYGQPRRGTERRYVVKFTSWNSLHIATVRALWPEVPALFLYRDPIEVIVSNLRSPPGWLQLKQWPARAALVFGWSPEAIAAMTREEYCARVLARFCEGAAHPAGKPTMFVDYRELDGTMLARIAEFFGIEPTRSESRAMQAVAGVYSKAVRGRRRFRTDSARKRRTASPLVEQMADKWAKDVQKGLRTD